MTAQEPWSRRFAAYLGHQIQHYRRQHGMLARELADRSEQFGHRVDTNVIANMESGRRAGVPIADVLVLAAALEIPPAMLVCPLGVEENVEPLPGWEVDPWTGYEWLTGYEAGSASTMTPEAAAMLRAYHRHWLRLDTLQTTLPFAQASGDARDQVRKAALSLGDVRREMQAAGWHPPPITPEVETAISDAERREQTGK